MVENEITPWAGRFMSEPQSAAGVWIRGRARLVPDARIALMFSNSIDTQKPVRRGVSALVEKGSSVRSSNIEWNWQSNQYVKIPENLDVGRIA